MTTSDHDLVMRAKAGCKAALSTLITRHMPLVKRQLQRFPLGEDREDVLQDAIMKAMSSLHLFREDSRFGTWLYRIVANAALMRLRTDGRRRARHGSSVDADVVGSEESIFSTASWTLPVDRQIERSERGKRVASALKDLPKNRRHLIVACYVNDLPLKVVAEDLGTTEPAVRSALARARTTLREALREEMEP